MISQNRLITMWGISEIKSDNNFILFISLYIYQFWKSVSVQEKYLKLIVWEI